MQATITEMANNISVLVQAVTRLKETNRPRRSVSATSNVSHRSGNEHGFSEEGAVCSFFRKGKCKDGDHCRFRHSLPLDDPRGDKSRPDGWCQVPLEVTNVSDTRNIRATLLGTDNRRPISAFINASSVGVNSGGATRENSVDSRLRPVAATTAPLLAGESMQRILSRKDPMTTDPSTLQVSGILQRGVDPRSLNPVRAVQGYEGTRVQGYEGTRVRGYEGTRV